MYLPGMGRIATTPILAAPQRKKNDDYHTDLKKDNATIEKSIIPVETKAVSLVDCEVNPAADEPDAIPIMVTETVVEPPKVIHYRVWPGGPMKTFSSPIANDTTIAAATLLQKMVRGKCARTNYYVRQLEMKLQALNEQRLREVQAVQADQEHQKVLVRRKVTQKQASLLKNLLDTKKTASQGSELINYLRQENKKLRQKNEKIAASIHALKVHNEQLESLTNETGENHNLLGTHYDKIQETNTLLLSVVPQYESKIEELQGALEVRQQYCDVENKMKVLYMKLIGTVTEMMEQDYSHDPELIQEIMQYCADLPSEMIPPPSLSTTPVHHDVSEHGHRDEANDQMNGDPTEYDEVSVTDDHHMDDLQHDNNINDDDDDSDSNNYDDYTIAGMD